MNLRVQLARPTVGSNVIQKHTQSMLHLLNLVCAVGTWKSGRLYQIVDVPAPQIDQERVKMNIKNVWRRINWHLRNAFSTTQLLSPVTYAVPAVSNTTPEDIW